MLRDSRKKKSFHPYLQLMGKGGLFDYGQYDV